jgi:sulfatase maturation enzyme AslB (radical SAM superfamily)
MITDSTQVPDNYCTIPFIGLNLTAGHAITPCCSWQNQIEPSPLKIGMDDPFNHEWMQNLRRRMLDNQVIPGCSKCKFKESINVGNGRQSAIIDHGYVTRPKLTYLDYNFGNLCNLKCRMCDGSQSTSWHKDEEALGWKTHKIYRHDDEYKKYNLSQLTYLRLIGGEPMMEQHKIIEILQSIKSLQNNTLENLSIELHTNGTVRFNKELTMLISQCQSFNLVISIDGFGKFNDYQRTGFDWHKIELNLYYFNDENFCYRTNRRIYSTLTLLTINNYIDFYSWVANALPRFYANLSTITYPKELRICNIPHDYKQILKNRFSNWKNGPVLNLIFAELDLPCQIPRDEIQAYISTVDQLRNEDFSKVDPEMYAALFQ